MCDVAETLLLDDARQADAWRSMTDSDGPSHVEKLRSILDPTDDDGEGGDADVIVLADFTPRELALELGLQ